MNIKTADAADTDRIRQIHLKAFGDGENRLVANLAVDLLNEPSIPETFHLVAEMESDLVGHLALSPVHSKARRNLVGYLLAPLAVGPSFQKRGIGKALVREGLEELTRRDVGVVLVYGDPAFYSRFGFSPELAGKYLPPFALKYPFGWQAIDTISKESATRPEPIECVRALNKPELW